MSDLSNTLALFPTSSALADWCEANAAPLSSAFCRLFIDRPPFEPNIVAAWAANNPNITVADFTVLEQTQPAIRDALIENLRRHAPHLWAKPLGSFVATPRTELFQDHALANILPLDEQYIRVTSDALREWIAPYRDAYPWSLDKDDCDDKGARIMGYAARCPHPRPSVGVAVITGQLNGIGQGHVLNCAPCLDGLAMIENDGSVYLLQNGAFAGWTEVSIMGGLL